MSVSTDTDITQRLKTPSMWKVIIHNDDFTPVDFVVALIHNIFNKSLEESLRLTYIVHNNGKANIGLYTKEVALTKVSQVLQNAEYFGHPLLATTEES